MHILALFLLITCILCTTPYLTLTGVIALAKLQQQQAKAITNVLKARAERQIAMAKFGQNYRRIRSPDYIYDPDEKQWEKFVGEPQMIHQPIDVPQKAIKANQDVPCEFGRCANPSQDPRLSARFDQQQESQAALENTWASDRMNAKDNPMVLRGNDGKSADPTHHHQPYTHTHFHQKTYGVPNGGYVPPAVIHPPNVHVIQQHGYQQHPVAHQEQGFGYNAGHGAALLVNGHDPGHGGQFMGHGDQVAQISGHGNTLVQNQNVHSGFGHGSSASTTFVGGRMGENNGDDRRVVVAAKNVSRIQTPAVNDHLGVTPPESFLGVTPPESFLGVTPPESFLGVTPPKSFLGVTPPESFLGVTPPESFLGVTPPESFLGVTPPESFLGVTPPESFLGVTPPESFLGVTPPESFLGVTPPESFLGVTPPESFLGVTPPESFLGVTPPESFLGVTPPESFLGVTPPDSFLGVTPPESFLGVTPPESFLGETHTEGPLLGVTHTEASGMAAQNLTTIPVVETKTEASVKNKSISHGTTTEEAQYEEEEGFDIPTDAPLKLLTGKNNSDWGPLKKVFYVPKGKTVSIIPVLHVPINYTGIVDPLELIIIDHRKNGTLVLNPDFNPSIAKRKKIKKVTSSSEESSESNTTSTSVVNDDPAAIYKMLAEQAAKDDRVGSTNSQDMIDDGSNQIKKIVFGTKHIKVNILPTLHWPKHEETNQQNIHINETNSTVTMARSEPINSTDFNTTLPEDYVAPWFKPIQPELSEFTKQVIQNDSRKISFPPVRPLNSSYTGPKGPMQEIKFYPPGSNVEINPVIYVPKTFNGTLKPFEVHIDHRNASQSQNDFINQQRHSEGDQEGDRQTFQRPNNTDVVKDLPVPVTEHGEKASTVFKNRNFENNEQHLEAAKPELDEFTKEDISNASKKAYVQPQNSSFTGPNGPTQNISPGSHVEINPMVSVPKVINGTLDHRKNVSINQQRHSGRKQNGDRHTPERQDGSKSMRSYQSYQPPKLYQQSSAYSQAPSLEYAKPEPHGLNLNTKFRQYFQPFTGSSKDERYLEQPEYYNNYQDKPYDRPHYARNSRTEKLQSNERSTNLGVPQTHQRFGEDIGTHDDGGISPRMDYLDHERLGMNSQHSMLSADDTQQQKSNAEVLVSPNLFNIKPNSRSAWRQNNYYRNAAENHDLDKVILQQKNMVDSLKRDAEHNQDLMLISYLGESFIKDIERQRNESLRRHKRQAPLNGLPLSRLFEDPETTLHLPKTLDNLGAITKQTFEDSSAPIYHVRSMIGNAKDSAMSALKVIPNNVIIPSRYEITNLEESPEEVRAINMDLLNAKTGGDAKKNMNATEDTPKTKVHTDEEEFGMVDTFQKLGKIIQDSVNSGKNTIVHAGNMANDAKHVVMSARRSTPRLIISPLLSNITPGKATIISPKFLELSENKRGSPPDNFLGVGHLLDAVGVSNPNSLKIDLEKIIIAPINGLQRSLMPPTGFGAPDALLGWLKNIRMEKIAGDEGVRRTLSELERAKKSVGADSLEDFLQKIKRELRINPQQEDEAAPSSVLRSGLNLPTELLHPFMGQATKDQLDKFLEENGDKVEATKSDQALEETANAGLGHILGATSPLMFEKFFNDTVKDSQRTFSSPAEMFNRKEETQGDGSNARTSMKIQGQMIKPFMGSASKKHKKEFLDKYNNYYPEEHKEDTYQTYEYNPGNLYVESY